MGVAQFILPAIDTFGNGGLVCFVKETSTGYTPVTNKAEATDFADPLKAQLASMQLRDRLLKLRRKHLQTH